MTPLQDLSEFYHVFEYLDTNGDQSGDTNAVGDYSDTPTEFFYQPAAGCVELISRMVIYMGGKDVGKGGYGNGDALTNGIRIQTANTIPEATMDLDGGRPIFAEKQWKRVCYDLSPVDEESRSARWTFAKSGLPLILSHEDRLVVTLHDDFSHMDEHTFMVHGSDASHGWLF